MPVGVVGRSKHVVIHVVVVQFVGVVAVVANLFGVGKVQNNQSLGVSFANSFGTCVHQLGNVPPSFFTAHCAVCFVAYLHHANANLFRFQSFQTRFCVFVHGVCFCFQIHPLPFARRHLFGRIRPKVGVVEVYHQIHAEFVCAFTYFHCRFDVAVASAKTVSVFVKGVVPHANANGVDAVVGKNFEHVRFRAVEVEKFHSAFFQRKHAGRVHAHHKIVGKIFHFFHVQSVGGNSVFCVQFKRRSRIVVGWVASRHSKSGKKQNQANR